MNPNEFISELESFYNGDLPEKARKYTLQYLNEYHEGNLKKLFGIVLKYHPINYGTPAIATIEKAHREYNFGDQRTGVPGKPSLKIDKTISATRPVIEDIQEEDLATDEEIKEMFLNLSGYKS